MRLSLVLVALAIELAACAAQRQRAFDEGKAKCESKYPGRIGNYVPLQTASTLCRSASSQII
jgi:hypothetical protein